MIATRPTLAGSVASAVALSVASGMAPAPTCAQALPHPAATVADEFQRGFQSMAWAELVERMHPDAVAHVRLAVDIVVDADTTGWALEQLAGGVSDRAAYARLDDDEVFLRAMRAVQLQVPGLLSSLVSRRSEVVGTVPEGPDMAHVVYRMLSLVQGAVPRITVMTLVRTDDGWKVRAAEELDVLHTALRGIPRPGRTP